MKEDTRALLEAVSRELVVADSRAAVIGLLMATAAHPIPLREAAAGTGYSHEGLRKWKKRWEAFLKDR